MKDIKARSLTFVNEDGVRRIVIAAESGDHLRIKITREQRTLLAKLTVNDLIDRPE